MTQRVRDSKARGQRIGGDHVTHCLARSFCVSWLDNYDCQNILQSLLNAAIICYQLLLVMTNLLYYIIFFQFYVNLYNIATVNSYHKFI